MAHTRHSLQLGVAAEVEITLNHQSYFTVTENPVAGRGSGGGKAGLVRYMYGL